MGLFNGRAQRPLPAMARYYLRLIPSRFKDDGCSNSLDSWFGFDFRWACRIHDWFYCTRCHLVGTMTSRKRQRADLLLRRFLRASVPWRWGWLKWIYWLGVHYGGGIKAFDSCGPEAGELCRHNMPMPAWMMRQERKAEPLPEDRERDD